MKAAISILVVAGLLFGWSTKLVAKEQKQRSSEQAIQVCVSHLREIFRMLKLYEHHTGGAVGFPKDIELDAAAKKHLDVILAFMRADPTVNHVELDGHSDNSGNRLTNRDLSRRRALAVMEYLKANGVPEEHIVMRFHGEQFPLVPNNSPANRARNRRVNIELERVTGEQKAAPAAFVMPPTPVPSAHAPAAAAPVIPVTAAKPAVPPAPAIAPAKP